MLIIATTSCIDKECTVVQQYACTVITVIMVSMDKLKLYAYFLIIPCRNTGFIDTHTKQYCCISSIPVLHQYKNTNK